VPREEITFRDGSEQEIAQRQKTSQVFFNEKAALKLTTPYGLEYSPHYQRKSREQQKAGTSATNESDAEIATGKKL